MNSSAAAHDPTEYLLERLENVRRTDSGIMASCPCAGHKHDDRNRSLSVTAGTSSKGVGLVLAHCHAGHTLEDITEALDVPMTAMFADYLNGTGPTPAPQQPKKQRRRYRARAGDIRYELRDEDGELVAVHVRGPRPKGQKDPRPWVDPAGWLDLDDVGRVETLPLYGAHRLPEMNRGKPVFVVEGEHAADVAQRAGLQVLGTVTGAAGCPSADVLGQLATWTAPVVLCPDNDDVGRTHMEGIRTALPSLDYRVLDMDGTGDGHDLADLLHGGTAAQDHADVAVAPTTAMVEAAAELEGRWREPEPMPKRRQGERIAKDVEADVELFTDGVGTAYVRATVRDHVEVIEVGSGRCEDYIRVRESDAGRRMPSTDAVREATVTLRALARMGGKSEPVYLRVADLGDGVAIDLGDDAWNAILIRPGSWSIEPHPVAFVRGRSMAALPRPTVGAGAAGIEKLRPLLNLTGDDGDRDWRRIVGFLLGCIHPRGPYLALDLTGPAGSAKSTAARLLKSILDPSAKDTALGSLAKAESGFAVYAKSNWIPSFDNVSGLTPAQSDSLARLSTGYMLPARMLYSDGDEYVIAAKRPFIVTGIDTIDRGDLTQRATRVRLEARTEYAAEAVLDERFSEVHADVLGGILDVTASLLAILPTLPTTGWLARMVDHVRWVTAAESALGWERRSYEAIYVEMQASAQAESLDGLQWWPALDRLIPHVGDSWEGTMGELRDRLMDDSAPDGAYGKGKVSNESSWPRSARGLASAMDRVASGLLAVGINATRRRAHRGGARYTLNRAGHPGCQDCQKAEARSVRSVAPICTTLAIEESNGGGVEERVTVHIRDNATRPPLPEYTPSEDEDLVPAALDIFGDMLA